MTVGKFPENYVPAGWAEDAEAWHYHTSTCEACGDATVQPPIFEQTMQATGIKPYATLEKINRILRVGPIPLIDLI